MGWTVGGILLHSRTVGPHPARTGEGDHGRRLPAARRLALPGLRRWARG